MTFEERVAWMIVIATYACMLMCLFAVACDAGGDDGGSA